MKRIKFSLICLFASLVCIPLMAFDLRAPFSGIWMLESAEFREAPLNELQKETKTVYTLENISEVPFFDVVIEMKFPEIPEAEEENLEQTGEPGEKQLHLSDDSEEQLHLTDLADDEEEAIEDDTIIMTVFNEYINPIVQISNIHFEFQASQEAPVNQYTYVFLESGELILTSNEVFYTKNEKESMSARLHITLSRISN